MKLEDKVCSLDLAKRLRELGVTQESFFYWTDGKIGYLNRGHWEPTISAFAVAELGEMLPNYTNSWRCTDTKNPWQCSGALEGPDEQNPTEESFEAKTEADARAKMLIYLIEQKLVKP